jgi:hypothetical protein
VGDRYILIVPDRKPAFILASGIHYVYSGERISIRIVSVAKPITKNSRFILRQPFLHANPLRLLSFKVFDESDDILLDIIGTAIILHEVMISIRAFMARNLTL